MRSWSFYLGAFPLSRAYRKENCGFACSNVMISGNLWVAVIIDAMRIHEGCFSVSSGSFPSIMLLNKWNFDSTVNLVVN